MRYLPVLTTALLSFASFAAADGSSAATTTGSTSAATTTDSSSAATGTDGSIAVPTPAASGAVPVPSGLGYSYVGCWNETTWRPGGNRALKDGTMDQNNSATTESCLTFCNRNGYQYCGLEYGSECWGSPYFSTLSAQLPESNCSIGCAGNNSEVCGGYLTITLYNQTGAGKSSKKGDARKEIAGAVGAVALAGLMGAAFSLF